MAPLLVPLHNFTKGSDRLGCHQRRRPPAGDGSVQNLGGLPFPGQKNRGGSSLTTAIPPDCTSAQALPGQHPALPSDDSTAKGLWVARALGSLECCSLDCSVLPRPPSAGKAPSPRSTPPRPIPLGDPPAIAVQGRLRWPRFTEGSRLTNKVITITHFGQRKNLNTGLTRPNHLHFFPRHDVVFQRCFSVSFSINNNNSNNNNNNKCH